MIIVESSISCGVRQLYELRVQVFKDVVAQNAGAEDEDGFCTFLETGYCYIFSDNKGHRQGQQIADLIKEHMLGDIVELGWGKNPNSGNKINTWIWRYNGLIPKEWVDEKAQSKKKLKMAPYGCDCGDPTCTWDPDLWITDNG